MTTVVCDVWTAIGSGEMWHGRRGDDAAEIVERAVAAAGRR